MSYETMRERISKAEQMIPALDKVRNGANVHTVNKAIFYLRDCIAKMKEITPETLHEFNNIVIDARCMFILDDAEEALKTNDFRKLSEGMAHLF